MNGCASQKILVPAGPEHSTGWHARIVESGFLDRPATLQNAYQQADEETMLKVVLEGGELREARDK